MNKVVLIGRLVRDPELRYTAQSGNAMCSFTLAIDREISKDKRAEFESKGMPTADFIRVVTWGRTAEVSGNYLQKGKMVAVSGRIQTGSYTNQQGQKVYTTDVLGERIEILEWGDRNQNQGGSFNNFNQDYSNNYQNNSYNNNSFGPSSYNNSNDNGFNNPNDGGFNDSDDDFVPFDDDSKIPF